MAQPAQLAQPNFQRLSNHLIAACDEIVLIPNMPIGQQHAAMLDALAQINARFDQIDARFDRLDARFDRLDARFDRLPMQLRNATASLEAPLVYPHGIQIGAAFPGTKSALLRLSIANCITVAQALGLPALPPHTTAINRRQQIIDFLGCAMVAY
ncbi:hypothetical protein AX15_004101 [Amanita polypyramis BW_CC]|nr:hypothetical protein AX15_004101 [Amanita polypyramis BW_CC]